MRIIAGKFKSRKLTFPKTKLVRPAMDRVRETVFNMIGSGIHDARVLDLYAGSGSVGFEALSRGAGQVCFVEIHHKAVQCIRDNARLLGVEDAVTIRHMLVSRAIPLFKKDGMLFDYIFIDPPYGADRAKKTLMKLYQFDILAPHGCLVIEHSAHDKGLAIEGFTKIAHKKFGETEVTFLEVIQSA